MPNLKRNNRKQNVSWYVFLITFVAVFKKIDHFILTMKVETL